MNDRGSRPLDALSSTVGNRGLSWEGRVGADLALGVAGISQLPFVDKCPLPLGLLAMGAPRGDARLTLADGDLPYTGVRELPVGNSEIGEFTSRTVAANGSHGERTGVSTSVGA